MDMFAFVIYNCIKLSIYWAYTAGEAPGYFIKFIWVKLSEILFEILVYSF